MVVSYPDFYNKGGKNLMITRNGVCYDFNRSSYRLTIDNLTFVFSSQLHLEKFKAKQRNNRNTINRSLSKRFNLDIDVSQLADIVLYKKIESRGFLIVTNEGTELWQISNMQFGGGRAISKNSNE